MGAFYYSAERNAFFPESLKDDYKKNGTWPSDALPASKDEFLTYGTGRPPTGMQRSAGADGHPTWIDIPPITLDQLAARQRAAIDAARDEAFAAGMPYTLPDGSADTVQTRPQDQRNLLGLSIKAERLDAQGVTDPVMPFRGEKNVEHLLAPADMLAMTEAADAHILAVYQQSWAKKDAIDAALADDTLTDDEKRVAIEAVEW